MSIQILQVRHAWPERAGFTINRPKGLPSYTFLCFHNSVLLTVGGETVCAGAGSCIIYDLQTPQWFQSIGPLTHDWMHLAGDVPQALAAVGLETDRLYSPQHISFITDATRSIESEHFAKPPHHSLMNELRFRQMLVKLSRLCNHQAPQKRLKPALEQQLLQVRNAVFSRLGDDWTVDKMAALCYLSPSRFHAVYHAMFGISPTDDLIHARIENAKNRLSGSQEAIHIIADSLGYRNVTHFCRQFKKLTGMTPTQYREQEMRAL